MATVFEGWLPTAEFHTVNGHPGGLFHFGEAFANGICMVEVRQGEEVKTVKAVNMRN